MLLRTRAGDAELRSRFSEADDIPRMPLTTGFSEWAGVPVSLQSVVGLPAASAALRIISETIGMIPVGVFAGEDEPRRRRRRDVWQAELLHDSPSTNATAFDLFQDVATSIETTGDAFIFKAKVRADRVDELVVLDPSLVEVRRNGANRKVFDVHVPTADGRRRVETFSPATILHIRGWALTPGADTGVSPIELHRNALGTLQAMHAFEGRFFRNNARPGGVIEVPQDVGREKIEKAREVWEESHRGPNNLNRIGVLAFGAKYRDVGFSMADAQFVESKQLSVEEIARIFRINTSLLDKVIQGQSPPVDELFQRFLKLDLAPRLRRIESALAADRDLFPEDSNLFPEFITDAVLRPDIETRYGAYRLARQGGWMAINEIRQKENLPPVDGGDEVQQTPVGGAPNEQGGGQ